MKSIITSLVVTGSLLLSCASGLAAGNAPAKVTGDIWTSGDTGWSFPVRSHISVEATVATARHPAVAFVYESDFTLDGQLIWEGVFVLDTVEITGNQAYLAGEFVPGRMLEVWITDNASPGRKGDVCQFAMAPYGLVDVPIEEGNFVVH